MCLLKAFPPLTQNCEADLLSLHTAFTPNASQMTGEITHDGAEVEIQTVPSWHLEKHLQEHIVLSNIMNL